MINIHPPLWALCFICMSLIAHTLSGASRLVDPVWSLTGGIWLVGDGLFLTVWAASVFKKSGTPIVPTETPTALVVNGPYRFTRNPMYLGIFLVLLGLCVAVGTWPMLFAPAAFLVLIRAVFIPYEELKMERLFGTEYTDYRKKTPMILL